MNKLTVLLNRKVFGFAVLTIFASSSVANSTEKSDEPQPVFLSIKLGVNLFDRDFRLQEAGNMSESADKKWWVNSGGYFFVTNGIGSTVQGELLPENDRWRRLYATRKPSETDDGTHPQNLFRLVSRDKFVNAKQLMFFRINTYHQSPDPNREGHNGVLFFSRYVDGDNLYYSGFRVDGRAVIKKKIKNEYFTLAQPKLLGGTYNRNTNPNLIQKNVWFGMSSQIRTLDDKSVEIILKISLTGNANLNEWKEIRVVDDGNIGGPPILDSGHIGIRTDFMDAEFRDYFLIK